MTAASSSPTVRIQAIGSSSKLEISPYDMGALTIDSSTGNLLKVSLAPVGLLGAKTNVDWLVRIVELDPGKLKYTASGTPKFQWPDLQELNDRTYAKETCYIDYFNENIV